MSNGATVDLQDVTTYAPVRVFLAGLWRLLFGGVFAVIDYGLLYAMHKTAGEPLSAADPPRWMIDLIPIVLGAVALLIISSGVGRMVSAFSRRCFFRAGRDGISIRLPRQGWFGRFRLAEYWFKWSEVEKLVHFTYRVNGIPTGTELRIHLRDGTKLRVDRMYFSASVKSLQQHLLAIQAMAAKEG